MLGNVVLQSVKCTYGTSVSMVRSLYFSTSLYKIPEFISTTKQVNVRTITLSIKKKIFVTHQLDRNRLFHNRFPSKQTLGFRNQHPRQPYDTSACWTYVLPTAMKWSNEPHCLDSKYRPIFVFQLRQSSQLVPSDRWLNIDRAQFVDILIYQTFLDALFPEYFSLVYIPV